MLHSGRESGAQEKVRGERAIYNYPTIVEFCMNLLGQGRRNATS